MSFCLPVLQYEPDDAPASGDILQASKEQHAESGVQQQPGLSSNNSSSSRPAAANPAAATAAKSAPAKGKGTTSIKHKKLATEPQQQQQEQPDVAAKPDAMQALARERKRRAFIGMLKLLEHGAKDSSELQMLVAPVSDEELLQVAQERALAGKCGNALCKQPFMGQTAGGNYRMTGGQVQYIEPIEGDFYCSKSCSSFTQQLAVQLVNPLERIKPSALQKALATPSHKPQQQGVGAQGGGVTTMKSVIEERNPYQIIHEAESAGRRLDEAAAALEGDSTAAAAVEGYIPRQAPDTQPRHQQQQQQEAAKGVLQLEPVFKQPDTSSNAAADAAAVAFASSAAADSRAGAGVAGVSTTSNSSLGAAANQSAANRSTGASVSTTTTTTSDSSSQANGGEDLQQYLKVFRDHQQQKVQQLHQRDPLGIGSNGTSSSSTDSHATAAQAALVQQGEWQDNQAQQQQQQQQQAEQEKQSQRRVRFAPDIAFSCPADPAAHHLEQQQQEQQPVLTFTLCSDSSSSRVGGSAAAGSNGNALVGELQVATVSGAVDGDAAAAEAGGADVASSGDDTDQDVEQQQQQQVPEAWKLFLPPALGGVGVPVKQVFIEQSPAAAVVTKQRQRSQQQPQQEQDSKKQQRQQQQGGLPEPSNGKLPAQARNSSADGNSSAHGSTGRSGKSSCVRSPAIGHTPGIANTNSRPTAGRVPAAVSSNSAGAAAGAVQGVAAGAGSGSAPAAAAAGKSRKFSPLVRPRRSVVVLDEVPGVTLQHRGVRPGGHRATPPATAAAAATRPDGSSSEGAPGSTAAAAAAVTATSTTSTSSSSSSSMERQVAAAHSKGVQSTTKKKGVVQIGPLRDHGSQEASYGYRNGIGGSEESEGGSESGSESDMSDASSQDEWCPEGNRSSRGAGKQQQQQQQQQQRLQHNSKAAASDAGGDPWDSDSDAAAADSDDGGADGSWKDADGEGSDAEAALDVGADGLSVQSAKEALDSMMPFFDTKGITITLSEFGLLWNTLHGWVSPSTLAYVADRRAVGVDSSSSSSRTADSSSSSSGAVTEANGGTDAGAGAAEQQPTEPLPVLQQRIALVNLLTAALPAVTQTLSLPVSEAQISKHLTALVRTFYLPGPLPALQSRQWQLLLTLMLGALAAWQLPGLRPVFRREQQAGSNLCVLLQGLGSDVDRFWALMDLFELHA